MSRVQWPSALPSWRLPWLVAPRRRLGAPAARAPALPSGRPLRPRRPVPQCRAPQQPHRWPRRRAPGRRSRRRQTRRPQIPRHQIQPGRSNPRRPNPRQFSPPNSRRPDRPPATAPTAGTTPGGGSRRRRPSVRWRRVSPQARTFGTNCAAALPAGNRRPAAEIQAQYLLDHPDNPERIDRGLRGRRRCLPRLLHSRELLRRCRGRSGRW